MEDYYDLCIADTYIQKTKTKTMKLS